MFSSLRLFPLQLCFQHQFLLFIISFMKYIDELKFSCVFLSTNKGFFLFFFHIEVINCQCNSLKVVQGKKVSRIPFIEILACWHDANTIRTPL